MSGIDTVFLTSILQALDRPPIDAERENPYTEGRKRNRMLSCETPTTGRKKAE